MIGKAYALVTIPNQRLFSSGAAAKYLGLSYNTLKKLTDLGELPAYRFHGRRAYKLEELDRLVDSLPEWAEREEESVAL